jgi:hypothetical protein
MVLALEDEWRRLAREEPMKRPVDMPHQSLLRVAHHALAGLLALEELER